MAESPAEFTSLIQRARTGDEQAAADLFQRYERLIRCEIRMWMRNPRLRRQFDSVDVCQSVFGSFFTRLADGHYEINEPAQLVKLLATMARNKVVNQAAKAQAQRRDYRRLDQAGDEALAGVPRGASPSRVASGREILAEIRRRLTEEERQVADLRSEGYDWSEIARKLGGTPDGRRMQLKRAMARVTSELGIDDAA